MGPIHSGTFPLDVYLCSDVYLPEAAPNSWKWTFQEGKRKWTLQEGKTVCDGHFQIDLFIPHVT